MKQFIKLALVAIISVFVIKPAPINKQVFAITPEPPVVTVAEPQTQVAAQPVAPEPIVPVPSPVTVASPQEAQQIAKVMAAQRGWTGGEWEALEKLWHNESGWEMFARNPSSGACGIPQALPCGKIPDPGNINSQLEWGLNYIAGYGNPTEALAFWHCTGHCYSKRTDKTIFKANTWY